jgi:hypothetical protein
VLRQFNAPDGKPIGVITRNAYGCLVINTVGLLFVDVDTPEQTFGESIRSLFRRSTVNHQAAVEERVLTIARRWVERRPGWHWRIYRTAAGVRLTATHLAFEPHEAIVGEAFEAFGADPLYRSLCGRQKCFRARLTPKPWRCGVEKVPARWPWPNAKAESLFKIWEARYLSKADQYATCKLIADVGSNVLAPELENLIKTHDEFCRANSNLPLA